MRRFTIWDKDNGDEEDGDIVEIVDDRAFGMLLDLEARIAELCEGYDSSSAEYPDERVVCVRETDTSQPIIEFTVSAETVRSYSARLSGDSYGESLERAEAVIASGEESEEVT